MFMQICDLLQLFASILSLCFFFLQTYLESLQEKQTGTFRDSGLAVARLGLAKLREQG